MNEDRLRQHLADKAAAVDATPGDPANLEAHSANPLLVMGAGLALVAVLGAGLAWLLPEPDDTDAAADTSQTTVALSVEEGSSSPTPSAMAAPGTGSDLPALTAGDGPVLSWQSGRIADGVFVNGIIPYGDGFVAWGQESPIEADASPPMQLWRSSDGLEWTALDATGLDVAGNFWVASMVAAGQRLVAVAVAYDPPPASDADRYYLPANERTFLLTSVDGVSWESTELATQPSGPSGNPGAYWSSGQPLLATRGDLVVLLTTQVLSFDPYIVVADQLGEEVGDIGGLSYGPDSIEVLGGVDGNEVIATFTPEELGIDPSYLANGGGPIDTRAAAYVSTDGGVTFKSRDTSGLANIGYPYGIVSTADEFIVAGERVHQGDPQGEPLGDQATWRSADGVSWTEGEPLVSGWLNGMDGFGSLIVGAGDNLVVSFDSGVTFKRVEGLAFDPVADVQFSIHQAETGAFGTLATGAAWQPGPPPPPLEVEVDGLIYREVYDVGTFDANSGPTVTITDAATGEVVFSKDNFWQPEYVSFDTAGDAITFLSPETGEPIITVDGTDIGLEYAGPSRNAQPITFEKDGMTFTAEFGDMGLGRVVITDTSGEVLFDQDNVFTPSYVRQDADGYTILDPDTGEPIMRLDNTILSDAYATQTIDTGSLEESVLWFSTDGASWSRQSVTEAFGVAGWTQATAVGRDRVVITFQPNAGFSPRPTEQAEVYVAPPTQVWVGTLP